MHKKLVERRGDRDQIKISRVFYKQVSCKQGMATPIKFPVSHHIEGVFQCARAEHKHKHKTHMIGERSKYVYARIALLITAGYALLLTIRAASMYVNVSVVVGVKEVLKWTMFQVTFGVYIY